MQMLLLVITKPPKIKKKHPKKIRFPITLI